MTATLYTEIPCYQEKENQHKTHITTQQSTKYRIVLVANGLNK